MSTLSAARVAADRPKSLRIPTATCREVLSASQFSSSTAMFALVKFFTLNAMSPTSARTSPDLRTVSWEKSNPWPVLFSDSTKSWTAARASPFHCAVAIDSRRSEYDSTVPPEFTRTKMSRTRSMSWSSSS
jgi:hypothetical protein